MYLYCKTQHQPYQSIQFGEFIQESEQTVAEIQVRSNIFKKLLRYFMVIRKVFK